MHTTFQLRTRAPLLKPNTPTLHTSPQLQHALNANILERMLQASIQIRQELLHGSLILHIT